MCKPTITDVINLSCNSDGDHLHIASDLYN